MPEEKNRAPKPKYNLFQMSWWMVRRAAKHSMTVLPYAAALILCQVALNLLELLAGPAVIRQVEQGAPLGELLMTIGLFTGGLMLCAGGRDYFEQNSLFGRIQVRSSINNDLHLKFCRTSYPNTQDPGFLARAEKAKSTTNNNRAPSEYFWTILVELLQNLATFILWLVLLSALNPAVVAVVLVTSVLGFFAAQRASSWRYRHREESDRVWKGIYYARDRMVDAKLSKDVRIFGLAPWLEEIAGKSKRLLYDFYQRECRIFIKADLIDVFLTLARNGAAYAWLIWQVGQGNLSAASFLLYFSAISGFAGWVNGILTNFTVLRQQTLDLSQAREFLEEREPFRFEEAPDVPRDPNRRYTLELRDVSFRYPGAESDTLSHINLKISAGEKLAIVGLNGAGKTTLVKLLCGFLDPTGGTVLLNGQDIRQYNRRDYYKLLGAVFQDFSVLAGSITENVTQQTEGAAGVDLDRVRQCLDMAGLLEKVESLPQGLETKLDKDVYLEAEQLSGGQMQRLMLARALYKDGAVLVLDEPTAALDPIAESDLYQRYSGLSAGKTSLFISHRLASTRFCDRILLLEGAHIAESGTHEELLAQNGRYAELFEIQSKYYKEGASEYVEAV